MTIALEIFQHWCIFLMRIMPFLLQFWLLSKQLGRTFEMQFFEVVNVEIFSCV
jgi:hypothetical protein